MSYSLRFSVDGGKTWLPAPEGVRVAYDGITVEGPFPSSPHRPGVLSFNLTHEGVVTDLCEEVLSSDGIVTFEVAATDSQAVDDILSKLS